MIILLALGIAQADVPSEDRWVGNDNLTVGVHEDGSFVNEEMEIGIEWDPDGAEGDMPLGGDMIRVGRYWDLLIWGWENEDGDLGGQIQGGPHTEDWKEVDWSEKVDNDAVMGLRGELYDDPLDISYRIAALQRDDVVIYDLYFTSDDPLTRLAVGRTFDPDQDFEFTETYDTINVSGENWAYGAGAYDDRAIALAGAIEGSDLTAGGVCTWCDNPGDMLESRGESTEGDNHPNVLVQINDLDADSSLHIRFVYAFAIGGEDARDVAIDYLELEDIDDDGLSEEEGDCDDWEPDVYPDATELTDGLDNDCDGEIDEDSLGLDDDGDGFSESDGDCDDEDPDVFPGADPVDGVVNADCDGVSDAEEDDDGDEEDDGDEDDDGEDDGEDDSDEDDSDEDDSDDEDTGGDADAEDGNAEGDDESTFGAFGDDEAEDGQEVTSGDKQGCSCATTSGSMQWSWLLALLLWGQRRRPSE